MSKTSEKRQPCHVRLVTVLFAYGEGFVCWMNGTSFPDMRREVNGSPAYGRGKLRINPRRSDSPSSAYSH